MKARSFLSAGALAIAVAGLAAPTLAAAQDQPRHEDGERRGNPHEFPRNRGGAPGGDWGQRGNAPARPVAPPPAPVARQNTQAPGNFGDMRARMEQARRAQAEQRTQAQRSAPVNGGGWGQRRDGDRERWNRGDNDGRGGTWNRTAPQAAPNTWNSGDRTRDPRWSDQRREGDRSNWRGDRDGVRDRDRGDYRRDHRDWDRSAWRRDNRYDWQRYRDAHRDAYRIGRYSAPYRGYSYRRVGIGFSLGSLFYTNRYWIDDPWSYRLPEVYGPYRWVRYYDDVLLVNIYTGQVVDVINDFFW